MIALNQLVAKLYSIKIEYIALPITIVLFLYMLHLKYYNYILLVAAMPIGVSLFIILNRSEKREKETKALTSGVHHSARKIRVLNILFFIFYGLSFFTLLHAFYAKPIMYFIFISLCAGAIATEIFFVNTKTGATVNLIKSYILGLNLFLSNQILFPYGIGHGDSQYHLGTLVLPLTSTGHSIGIAAEYEYFPGHQILVAMNSIITSIDPKMMYYCLAGFFMSVMILFAFIIGSKFISLRVGLFCSLIYISCDQLLCHASYASQPSYSLPLAMMIFVVACYLGQTGPENRSTGFIVLFYILATVLIFTHHHSAILVFIMLICILIAELIKKIEEPDHQLMIPKVVVFFFVAFLTQWMYYSNRMPQLVRYLKMFYDAIFIIETSASSYTHQIYEISFPAKVIVLNTMGSAILILLATIGVLYFFKRHSFFKNAVMIVSVAILLLIGIGVLFKAEGLLPHRTFAFLQEWGLVFLAAGGVSYLIGESVVKYNRAILALALIVSFVFFSTFSLTAGVNTSPLLDSYAYERLYVTPFDRYSSQWTGKNIVSNSTIIGWGPNFPLIETETVKFRIDTEKITNRSFIRFSRFDFKPGFHYGRSDKMFGKFEEKELWSFDKYNRYYDNGMTYVFYKGKALG